MTYFVKLALIVLSLMTGILSLFRELHGIYFPERVPSRVLFWRCVWIAFVISAALLWWMEHSTVVALTTQLKAAHEMSAPRLKASIREQLFGRKDREAFAILVVAVSNEGADSAVIGYQGIVSSGAKRLVLQPTMPTGTFTLSQGGGKPLLVIRHEDWIFEKTATPIKKGEVRTGYLMFRFGADSGILEAPKEWALRLFDYRDHAFESHTEGPPNPLGEMEYFAGSGDVGPPPDTSGPPSAHPR